VRHKKYLIDIYHLNIIAYKCYDKRKNIGNANEFHDKLNN